MSLFGWREKRHNKQLQRRVETLVEQRDDARKLAGIHQGNLMRMAQARANEHDEVTALRKENEALTVQAAARAAIAQDRGNALGRLSNRLANIEGEYDHIDGYAARMEERLDRALKACARYWAELSAQYRVTDFLGQQLMDSVSGQDPRPKALADAVKSSEVTS
jgi:chromosome segregation ATPase